VLQTFATCKVGGKSNRQFEFDHVVEKVRAAVVSHNHPYASKISFEMRELARCFLKIGF